MKIIQVALPVCLGDTFDYTTSTVLPVLGSRVLVPFGRRTMVGVVFGYSQQTTVSLDKIKDMIAVLDPSPFFSEYDLTFMRWASTYYQEPLGMVASTALPTMLKSTGGDAITESRYYKDASVPDGKYSDTQQALINFVRCYSKPLVSHRCLLRNGFRTRTIAALLEKSALIEQMRPATYMKPQCLPLPDSTVVLNAEQQRAVDTVDAQTGYQAYLLDGVTGSGKTQVYLEIITSTIAAGKQALVLLPEIGLTPQTVERFRQALQVDIAVLNSNVRDIERAATWLDVAIGEVPLVIGTRLAIFTPIPNLGVIVVDEEHDLSFKQQSGFRYSARDLALVKAKQYDIPVILGTATPSLESYHNVQQGRYQHLVLHERAGAAQLPQIDLVDMRSQKLENGMSKRLLQAVKTHLSEGNQVLLFLNRRGFCPVLMCQHCGWIAVCERCDRNYTYHHAKQRLHCHACEASKPVPTTCGHCHKPDLLQVGQGTEKLAERLAEWFPEVPVTRVDRDSVQGKVTLGDLLAPAYAGGPHILIGTQMLAKGHHLPKLTLVAIVDVDGALFSSDFRSVERLMQTVVQVAGRAGRADHLGQVLLQTHMPENPFLQCVIQRGYHAYMQLALADRARASMPPYSSLAVLHVEAMQLDLALQYLAACRESATTIESSGVILLGPMTASIPKRSGKYRAQLLVHALNRRLLQQYVQQFKPLLTKVSGARKVRWALDVDPLEIL